ncbi:MAG: gamma-glutamylcyclotransferase [Oculatellaceae cyanobacterium Prado106]|jgi:cation transport protein ChaC|nr:gamma-glutamylcyclotransferase [Oculatellaceae cyanobacterium Prado106]
MTLTRADLESQRLQQLIAQSGLPFHVLSEAELQASIAQVLQQRPPETEVWIFAYGSLIWNPIFQFCQSHTGTIYGYHRRFCLWTPLGRGTPENPGLVLGLDRGGSCHGVAYQIAAHDVDAELLLLWRREMVVGSYVPRWVKVFQENRWVEAIAFTINPQSQSYTGKIPLDTIAHHIATAEGKLGSCFDYFDQTIAGLTKLGLADRSLLKLQRRVEEIRGEWGVGSRE